MPFRFEEFNTLCGGGLKGASDTLGAALFVIDAAFSLIKVSWGNRLACLASQVVSWPVPVPSQGCQSVPAPNEVVGVVRKAGGRKLREEDGGLKPERGVKGSWAQQHSSLPAVAAPQRC